MRILHITTNYPTAEHPAFGAFVRSQVESLREKGVACEVFYLNGQGSFWRYLAAYFRLFWHLLTHRYDILHCHHALSGIFLCLTGAPLFSRTVLSYQNELSYEWGGLVYGLLYPFFRRIIFKSSITPACRKVRVLPNGCDPTRFYPMDISQAKQQLALDPDKQYILFIDSNLRARRQKREDRFDATVAKLRAQFPNVEPLKLRSVSPEQMCLYYNAAHLYLLCSDYEGSPNAAKECLMCNVPVVATPVGDLPYLTQFCPACTVVSSFALRGKAHDRAIEALAEAAAPILREPVAQRPASRENLLSLGYGLNETADRLLKIYQEIR